MSDNGGEHSERPRQLVSWTFYKVAPEWRRLDIETRRKGKEEFLAILDEFRASIFLRTYSLVGIRGDCDFMVMKAAHELELFNRIEGELNATGLGAYLERPFTYLAGLRRSLYLPEAAGGERHGAGTINPGRGGKYLFVYPFVKQRAWYKLTKAARQGMMNEHIAVGGKYDFEINTAYSFGLDDQEFVVCFEGDDPHHFTDLVMELRDTEASAYTQRDTPTFTCLRQPPAKVLELIG